MFRASLLAIEIYWIGKAMPGGKEAYIVGAHEHRARRELDKFVLKHHAECAAGGGQRTEVRRRV